jgi:integrase
MALTDTALRQAKPTSRTRKLFDGGGLYLLIAPTGGKWWRLKYRFGGKEKLLSLGTYPGVGLREARERRESARRLLRSGIDPSEQRKTQKTAQKIAEACQLNTFEIVARDWFGKYSAPWASSHAETVLRRLERDVFPWLARRPISEITAAELLTALRRIESRGALETAHRVKQIIGQVFRYAVATGVASRDLTADLRGALPPVRESHHAALTNPAEVAGLVRAIQAYSGSFIVRSALLFSAYTFGRPGEIRAAEWREIDFEHGVWRIGAERMKMRREHLVPLARQVVELLREIHPLTGGSRYIFTGRTAARCLSENALTAALRRMGFERTEMTAHGFRTTASTLLNEQGWNRDAIERQLAHAERDEVRAAYNRAEHLGERRKMMQFWADYLDSLAAGNRLLDNHNLQNEMRAKNTTNSTVHSTFTP